MKKIFTLTMIFWLAMTGLVMAQNNPVVYLPLDENLNDASGNNLHAVDFGAANTSFINDPERGKVASFEAAAHAKLPLDPKLNFVGTQSFSIAFWVKIDASQPIPKDPALISNKDWGSGSSAGFIIGMDNPDEPTAHWWTVNVADGAKDATPRLDWDADDNDAINIKDGAWHFIAVVFDRNEKMNVYVDGELKQTDPAQDSYDLVGLLDSSLDAGLPITLMQDGTGLYPEDFSALLDDVLIYDKVLTADDVASLNDNGYIVLPAGLAVLLPLDENLNDISGNNLHGVDFGTTPTSFVNDFTRGKVANFLTEAHAKLPLDAKLNFVGTQSFSLALWIKIDPSQPMLKDPAIISNKDWGSGSNAGFIIGMDNPDEPTAHWWTVNVADGAKDATPRLDWDADDNEAINIKDGNWHFITVVFDRNDKMNVYVDGELKQTDPAQDSYDLKGLLDGSLDAGLPITLMQDGTGLYGEDFSALLDEVAIFNRVLTTEEISNFYQNNIIPKKDETVPTFGSTVYLPFDENLNDISGNDLNASDQGSSSTNFVTDLTRGKVAEFVAEAHAELPLVSALDFVNNNSFSVAFWVNIPAGQSVTSDPVILSNKDWSGGRNPGFLIGLDNPDTEGEHMWTVNVGDGTGRLDWDADDNNTINIKDGTWHHVAVVFDRAAKMNVYLDGELRQEDTAADSYDLAGIITSSMQSDLPITIMQDGTGAYPEDFIAFLDNLLIWNKTLTSEEIAEVYNTQYIEPYVEPYDPVLSLNDELNRFGVKVFPNPATESAVIKYTLQRDAHVAINLLDTRGYVVENVRDEIMRAGEHEEKVNVADINEGLYLYTVQIGNYQYAGRILIKK